MIRIVTTIGIVVCFLLLLGCNTRDERRRAVLASAVDQVHTDWKHWAASAFRKVEDRWYNPRSRGKAVFWLDDAKQVRQASDSMITYIDSLRSAVAAGALTPDQVFDTLQRQTRLYDRVRKYKADMVSLIDTSQFQDATPSYLEVRLKEQAMISQSIVVLPTDTLARDSWIRSSWNARLLDDQRPEQAMLILQLIQGRIRMFEASYLEYLGFNARVLICGFWLYSKYTKATISSSTVKEGQPVTVYAGMSTPFIEDGVRIYADTIPLLIDHDGWAAYKVKVSGTPGKYSLPVHFEYKEYGQIRTQTRVVEYFIDP